MDYNNIYRSYQIQAAEAVLDPDEQAFYRKICRWYSKNFFTPLHIVEALPTDQILTNYYEASMEQIPYNDLYDIVMEDFLPELVQENEDNLEEFMQDLELEQAETLKAKSPKSHTTIKTPNKAESLTSVDQSGQSPNINITFPDEEP